MSIRKRPDSKFWQYEFQIEGVQFRRATPFEWRTTPKRTAQRWEDELKVAKRKEIAEANRTGGKTPSPDSVSIDYAFARYWTEAGQTKETKDSIETDMQRILDHLPSLRLSKDSPLGDINDNILAQLIAWRRSHHIKGDPTRPLISDATVNRSMTKRLQRIFNYARDVILRGVNNPFPQEPVWDNHLLEEEDEHPRMMSPDEHRAMVEQITPDYERLMRFSILSGLRQQESLIRKSEVNWTLMAIETRGKGRKLKVTAITPGIEKILRECWNDHPEFVFTYVAERTVAERRRTDKSNGQETIQQAYVRGRRYPITAAGLKTCWRRKRAKAAEVCPSVADYRWHDNRHTFGTNMQGVVGDTRLVQLGMNHADMKTTLKYVHVDPKLRAALVSAEQNHYLTGLAEGPKLLPPPEQKAG